MKVLWLSNMAPGALCRFLTGKERSGLWMDHVLEDLRKEDRITLHLLCPWQDQREGKLEDSVSYCTFRRVLPQQVSEEQTELFVSQLRKFRPDIIHIWGTEYGHTLSMVQACQKLNLLDRTVISIQGLCHYVARHYLEGLPPEIQKRSTLRDFLKQNNILQQQAVFYQRGEHEKQAISAVRHVIGRTAWDRACVRQWNPAAEYYVCNETLRSSFYEGKWQYENCTPHRIFASSRLYPIKGFHGVLEAFSQILRDFPDAVLAVPGDSPCCSGKARLRQDSYARYLGELMEDYELSDHVEFLGSLSEQQMRQQYLKANVFVMPSSIENSSNSLGEAMLLGVPCTASHVGGVTTMLKPGEEGIVYQSTAPYMLAEAVKQIFDLGKEAEALGAAAAEHARSTHDPEKNLRDLLAIYRELSGEA